MKLHENKSKNDKIEDRLNKKESSDSGEGESEFDFSSLRLSEKNHKPKSELESNKHSLSSQMRSAQSNSIHPKIKNHNSPKSQISQVVELTDREKKLLTKYENDTKKALQLAFQHILYNTLNVFKMRKKTINDKGFYGGKTHLFLLTYKEGSALRYFLLLVTYLGCILAILL